MAFAAGDLAVVGEHAALADVLAAGCVAAAVCCVRDATILGSDDHLAIGAGVRMTSTGPSPSFLPRGPRVGGGFIVTS